MLNGFAIMEFDTKIAIAVRDDLAVWQKLNVTAFITSGITGQHGALLGDEYEDASAIKYAPLLIQPVIVLTCDDIKMKTIHRRGLLCDSEHKPKATPRAKPKIDASAETCNVTTTP